MTALLRGELRKTLSVRLWWALAIPVLALSVLYNLFGALLAGTDDGFGGSGSRSFLAPLLSLAYTLAMTSVFGAVAGIVGAAGEFRHHTAATTYLLTPSRGRVLLAKMLLGGLVGALYAAAAAAVGVPTALLGGDGAAEVPGLGLLLGMTGVGMLVGALWAALGTALGTAIGNQVGALIVVLIYLLFVDRVLALLLSSADVPALAAVSSYLPGKAADIAVYDYLVRGLDLPGVGRGVVEEIATVRHPPPWWGALLVLAGWTALAGGIGWLVGARRDIT